MEKVLSLEEACLFLKASKSSLRKWDLEGKLKPSMLTPGKHRRYTESDLLKFQGMVEASVKVKDNVNAVIYSRVSTRKQVDVGNLQRQESRLMNYCLNNNYSLKKSFTEVSSGLNENRKELYKMIDYCIKNNIGFIVIEYKDRLARFGFRYIKEMLVYHNIEVIIVEENKDKELNYAEEMSNDIISIITCFSARLYGKRGGIKAKELLKEVSKNEDHNSMQGVDKE